MFKLIKAKILSNSELQKRNSHANTKYFMLGTYQHLEAQYLCAHASMHSTHAYMQICIYRIHILYACTYSHKTIYHLTKDTCIIVNKICTQFDCDYAGKHSANHSFSQIFDKE